MKFFRIIIFIVIAAALIGGGVWYNNRLDREAQEKAAAEAEKAKVEEANVLNKLKIEDLKVGSGAEAKNGDMVSVNYLGTLEDGKKFDSSYDRGEPFEFKLGAGQVIRGWELGLLGMKVGGKRVLTIPPELGYGAQGAGPIPSNATLKFTVELVSVKSQ